MFVDKFWTPHNAHGLIPCTTGHQPTVLTAGSSGSLIKHWRKENKEMFQPLLVLAASIRISIFHADIQRQLFKIFYSLTSRETKKGTFDRW